MTHEADITESCKAADARCAATVIDLIVSFPCLLSASPIVWVSDVLGFPWWVGLPLGIATWAFVVMAVLAAFESSPLRATPGKLACGLKVGLFDGARMTFRCALLRNIAKYALLLPGLIVLMRCDWRPDGALHDRGSGTMVTLIGEGTIS